jgi:pimeloyl-ACP methyl ester carboxylesterase
MKQLVPLAMAAMLASSPAAQAQVMPSTSATTTYHRAQVDGVSIFYREAGSKDAPTIVLLHGFPSSSRMFDTLMPLLASRYHLIAPDYPGFGQSEAPSPAQYRYTFDHLLEQLKIGRCVLY